MNIDGKHWYTIWRHDDGKRVSIIDQTKLPHVFSVIDMETVDDAAVAIKDMQVRGAPLIGATAAFGMALAMKADSSDAHLEAAAAQLLATRPTAVNLRWALDRMTAALKVVQGRERVGKAYHLATVIAEEDVNICKALGEHGQKVIEDIATKKAAAGRGDEPVRILTHCNAGWLATVDFGTALSPVYHAFDAGVDVEVWVDETRPRNQGASLTSWELKSHGVKHKVISDNAGGHLMQHGLVDLCIVGTDRTVANGDVCNKIGTYLKALAAHDNDIPFYVALPGPTIDWTLDDGRKIPIEERDAREVTHILGKLENGEMATVQLTPDDVAAGNPAFDVTPAKYVTGLITERGVCEASTEGLLGLYPEQRQTS